MSTRPLLDLRQTNLDLAVSYFEHRRMDFANDAQYNK